MLEKHFAAIKTQLKHRPQFGNEFEILFGMERDLEQKLWEDLRQKTQDIESRDKDGKELTIELNMFFPRRIAILAPSELYYIIFINSKKIILVALKFKQQIAFKSIENSEDEERVNVMKTDLKILPIIIGCALLVGVPSTSAASSYIGVSPGQTYIFYESITQINASSSTTYCGNFTMHIDNVTVGTPYTVDCTLNFTSGNLTQTMGGGKQIIHVIYPVYNVTVLNETTFRPIISINVVNKSYHNATSLYGMTTDMTGEWDSKGMVLWLHEYMSYSDDTVITIAKRIAPGLTGPINLQATGDDGQVMLSWQTPTNNGGFPITGYRISSG